MNGVSSGTAFPRGGGGAARALDRAYTRGGTVGMHQRIGRDSGFGMGGWGAGPDKWMFSLAALISFADDSLGWLIRTWLRGSHPLCPAGGDTGPIRYVGNCVALR